MDQRFRTFDSVVVIERAPVVFEVIACMFEVTDRGGLPIFLDPARVVGT